MAEESEKDNTKLTLIDRFLGMFSDVRAGESGTVLLMFCNIFLLLFGYYILKTVRESLILTELGPEIKSYASGAQAVLLMGFVPLYSWFAGRVGGRKLIIGVVIFFIINIELFFLGSLFEVPNLGFVFYVWLGIFSLAMIAQFWSLANDMYSESAGKRLFPVIMIGAAAGSPLGAKTAKLLFDEGVSAYSMMQIAVGILVVHLVLSLVAERRGNVVASGRTQAKEKDDSLAGSNGFALVLRSPYLRLIALVFILANLVNTTGEYILSKTVVRAADAAIALDSIVDKGAFIGSFYGDFFFYVNIVTLLIQAFLVSRIVKYVGIKGVLFALPLVAFGAYGVIALGAGFAMIRVMKTAENSTDYSVMNTAKALIWLPTSREEKYKAKQAVDTFFVRAGDMLSAGFVFVGTTLFQFGIKRFAFANLFLIALWVFITYLLFKEYRKISATERERG